MEKATEGVRLKDNTNLGGGGGGGGEGHHPDLQSMLGDGGPADGDNEKFALSGHHLFDRHTDEGERHGAGHCLPS